MTIATTKQGQVQGIEKFGSLQFRNIPFAAPPPRRMGRRT
jgi:hypothetical protein